jgi:integrase
MAQRTRPPRGIVIKTNTAGEPLVYVRLWHDGRVRWFGAFRTKTEARHFYEKAKTEQREGRFFPERYHREKSTLLSEAMARMLATSRKRSVRDDRRFAKFWDQRLPGYRLGTVTPAIIETVRSELMQRRIAAQTVVHYLKFLRQVMNTAVKSGDIPRSPFAQITLPKVSNARLRFLTLDEEARLCAAIAPAYRPWIRLAILTGLRQEEQFGLRWSDVDVEHGILVLPATKAGMVQYVRLNQEAVTLLRGLTSWEGSAWVFPSRNPGTHVNPRNFYRRTYLPAVRAARLTDVTWHTLRHTFASRLAMAGATEQEIAACLRHSSTALVRRYAHLSPGHLTGVMEKVSAFGAPTIDRTVDEPEIQGERSRRDSR